MRFNLFEKLQTEIKDFDSSGRYIVGKPESERDTKNKGTKGGYYYHQKELLESIDLASASKYKNGIYDEEGQRKTFINVVNFYRDVMKMKIIIRVANYIFEPRSLDFTWIAWLYDRKFKVWADEESYDDDLDEFADSIATYGTLVTRKTADRPKRVPLRSLRNTQTAKSLYAAAANGGYAIIEDEYHYNEMLSYPDWNLEGLDRTKSYTLQERYGLVPEGLLEQWRDLDALELSRYEMDADEEMILAQAIVILEGAGSSGKSQKVIFLEKVDEETFPLEECHGEQRDGRWLGVGEVEKQLENQLARNLNAHLRRRGILWATKKIFQSTDENVQKNLVMEVADGEVIHVGQNGQITQVNTSNQHTGDINSDDNAWKENSRERSFAFEVATGESMPSGTPFRLGVVLEQSVADHFRLVQRKLSTFLVRSFFDQVVEAFENEYRDEHEVIIPMGESDIENLKEAMIAFHTNERIFTALLHNGRPDKDLIRSQVEEEFTKNPYFGITVEKNTYKQAQCLMKLNITDDIGPEITELTSLYQALSAKGDPRADSVLAMILAKRGKSLDALIGPAPKPQAMPSPQPSALPAPVAPQPATVGA